MEEIICFPGILRPEWKVKQEMRKILDKYGIKHPFIPFDDNDDLSDGKYKKMKEFQENMYSAYFPETFAAFNEARKKSFEDFIETWNELELNDLFILYESTHEIYKKHRIEFTNIISKLSTKKLVKLLYDLVCIPPDFILIDSILVKLYKPLNGQIYHKLHQNRLFRYYEYEQLGYARDTIYLTLYHRPNSAADDDIKQKHEYVKMKLEHWYKIHTQRKMVELLGGRLSGDFSGNFTISIQR